MPQSVMIQTEPASPVSPKKAAAVSDSSEREAFSAHFNQQIRDDNKSAKTDNAPTGKTADTAKTAESDKAVAADGKNLPAEDKPQTDDEVSQQAAVDKPVESDIESEDAKAQTDNKPEDAASTETSDPELSINTDEDSAEPAIAANAVAANAGNQASEKSADKPIRAEVTVSQRAVDNAKAAPVSMTAKDHPQQTAAVSGDSEIKKAASNNEQVKPVSPDTVKAKIETPIAKLPEIGQADKKALPNLAAALKQLAQEDGETPKIRADILDALQRQQGKPEVTANLRNLIAAQTQQGDAKAPLPLPQASATALISDSSSPLLNTATTVNSLVSAGQQGGAQSGLSAQSGFSLPVQPNMQNPAWGQVMSSRVVWMAKEGVQEAQLKMNPARLGPVEVKLHVQNDQVSVTFLAQQSATREALEQALPRLRESFADNGMQLTDAQVGEQEQQQQEQSEQTGGSQFFSQAQAQDDDIDTKTVETVSSGEEPQGLSLYA